MAPNLFMLQQTMLRFLYVLVPHTSERLPSILVQSMMDWNVDAKNELDNYLNEDNIPRSAKFDIRMWWTLNGIKFPILQAIARDLLDVRVASIASKSEFSFGGRLLDLHRIRLHIRIVETLMCTRSWVPDELNKESESDATVSENCFSLLSIHDKITELENEVEDQVESSRPECNLLG